MTQPSSTASFVVMLLAGHASGMCTAILYAREISTSQSCCCHLKAEYSSVEAMYMTLLPHTSLAGPHSRLNRPSEMELNATTAVAMTLLVWNSSCRACNSSKKR